MQSIKFVYPRKTLPISVTGDKCELNCPHCKGHYLKHMAKPFSEENKIKNDVASYLVSGGCDSEGAVPLKDNLDLLKKLSKKHKVIAHTGLIKGKDVALISPYIYAASFNMIGDESTIKEIYNLNKTTKNFIDSYKALREKVKTFPHITIGLHHGSVKGEYNALDMLSNLGTETIVFNIFIPNQDTELGEVKPPNLNEIQGVISYARKKIDGVKLYLGCMRPGGSYREKLDEFCVKKGIDRIVMPSKSAKRLAVSRGYEITESQECCII
jgi:uncharacterized radical SAM superfamily protein